MYKGKLGVAIISYNRPHYFRQLIESLEKQTTLEETDFHLFQDGAKTPVDRSLINQCMTIFNSSTLPNITITKRGKNVSIAINQFEAVEEMTSKYDWIMVIEDDVILSPDYLRLIRILIEQYGNRPEVFGVSLNFLRRCNSKAIEKNLYRVRYSKEHWWAECFSSQKWKKVKPYFLEYYKLVKDRPYDQRPRSAITKLFRQHGLFIPQTSQDAGKDYALHRAKLKRINTVVNRGMYIGLQGTHFNARLANKYEFEKQVPYIFASDKTADKFILSR